MTDKAKDEADTVAKVSEVEQPSARVEYDGPDADALASIEELPPEEAFPRMVFRKGTTAKLNDGLEVDFLVVGNKTALRSALDHGWRLDPAS